VPAALRIAVGLGLARRRGLLMPARARVRQLLLLGALTLGYRSLLAQSSADSGFAGVQARGAAVMGVDQYTSHHVFEDLPDGGRIVLVRNDTADAAGTRTIRAHLRAVADSFARGIFSDPERVHAREVPGTPELARLRDRVRYQVSDRPGGAELRITTTDPPALAALRQFLAFQRQDHHAAGHEGRDHSHLP
jgi:hypothetical protein